MARSPGCLPGCASTEGAADDGQDRPGLAEKTVAMDRTCLYVPGGER